MFKKFITISLSILISIILFAGCSETSNTYTSTKSLTQNKINITSDVSPKFVTLMFHQIADKKMPGTTTITKEKLEEVLKYLSDSGYTFLSSNQVYEFMINKTPIPKKSVWLTFDDGLRNAYKEATPLLKKYHARATSFVETMSIDTPYRLTSWDLRSMSNSKYWDIQSHGHNGHITGIVDKTGAKKNFYFNRLYIGKIYENDIDMKVRLKSDILKSFDILKNQYGQTPYFFAYPLDSYTPETNNYIALIQSVLDEINVLGLGVNSTNIVYNDISTFKHNITRVGIENNTDIKDLFSLRNLGKRVYAQGKFFSYIAKLNNGYIVFDDMGNFVKADNNLAPISQIINIKENNNNISLNGKNSVVQKDGYIYISNWDSKIIYKTDDSLNVVEKFKLDLTPVSIFITSKGLCTIDPAGRIYQVVNDTANLIYETNYNIACTGASSYKNIVYIADSFNHKIYKINLNDNKIVGSKEYNKSYVITPQICNNEDEIVVNEGMYDVLGKINY